MYVPRSHAVDDEDEARAMVDAVGTAELVSTGSDGYPRATFLPILWEGATVIAHLARANDHWQELVEPTPALLVCAGPGAYVTPSWYAAKAEHGRVVPTWNYSTVHLRGTVRVHDDPAWVRRAVTALTERNESDRPQPWAVEDAPEKYVEGMLKAIVGLEFTVERVEAKAKLSQNRSEEDVQGVIAGLEASESAGDRALAAAMATMAE
jgi:transcriptional regulator